MSRFHDCINYRACCHVLSIPLTDQKLTIILFGSHGTHCFARKTSRDYEKEKPYPFLKKFLRQSQSSTSEPEPNNETRLKWFQLWNKRTRFLLADDLSGIFIFQIIFFSISIYSQPLKFNQRSYTKSSWSSQFPATESSGLSIFVPTLLLLQYSISTKISQSAHKKYP